MTTAVYYVLHIATFSKCVLTDLEIADITLTEMCL